MLEGDQPPVVVDDKKGIPRFAELEQLSAAVGNMTALQGSHHFGETWNSVLYTTLQQTEKLGAALVNTISKEEATFPFTHSIFCISCWQDQVELNHFMPEETSIGRQMDKVAKLVKLRSFTQNKRDVFLVQQTGFDTHNTFENFGLNLAALDSTLRPFRLNSLSSLSLGLSSLPFNLGQLPELTGADSQGRDDCPRRVAKCDHRHRV